MKWLDKRSSFLCLGFFLLKLEVLVYTTDMNFNLLFAKASQKETFSS